MEDDDHFRQRTSALVQRFRDLFQRDALLAHREKIRLGSLFKTLAELSPADQLKFMTMNQVDPYKMQRHIERQARDQHEHVAAARADAASTLDGVLAIVDTALAAVQASHRLNGISIYTISDRRQQFGNIYSIKREPRSGFRIFIEESGRQEVLASLELVRQPVRQLTLGEAIDLVTLKGGPQDQSHGLYLNHTVILFDAQGPGIPQGQLAGWARLQVAANRLTAAARRAPYSMIPRTPNASRPPRAAPRIL